MTRHSFNTEVLNELERLRVDIREYDSRLVERFALDVIKEISFFINCPNNYDDPYLVRIPKGSTKLSIFHTRELIAKYMSGTHNYQYSGHTKDLVKVTCKNGTTYVFPTLQFLANLDYTVRWLVPETDLSDNWNIVSYTMYLLRNIVIK